MFSRWCPHFAAALGMQRKVIYCCMKTWANQKVKFITKDNSCFHNSRSLSQKLCCVCSLGSQQENKWQQQAKLSRVCLAFAPFPSLHSQLVPGPGIYIVCLYICYLHIYHLHIHCLPQPLKTSIPRNSDTLTGPHRRPRFFSPQSLHDLHC